MSLNTAFAHCFFSEKPKENIDCLIVHRASFISNCLLWIQIYYFSLCLCHHIDYRTVKPALNLLQHIKHYFDCNSEYPGPMLFQRRYSFVFVVFQFLFCHFHVLWIYLFVTTVTVLSLKWLMFCLHSTSN